MYIPIMPCNMPCNRPTLPIWQGKWEFHLDA